MLNTYLNKYHLFINIIRAHLGLFLELHNSIKGNMSCHAVLIRTYALAVFRVQLFQEIKLDGFTSAN